MTENPTHIRIMRLLFICLVGLMSILFLPACTQAEQIAQITETVPPPTLLPSATPVPPTLTQPPLPSKTATLTRQPSPTVKASATPTSTPFSRSLEDYFLKFDEKATPNIPFPWSVTMWNIWGDTIPAMPVEATPQFISYPAPAELTNNAQDLFLQAGCKEGEYLVECDPDSPLPAFNCQWWVGNLFSIPFPATPELSPVVECPVEFEDWEKAPEDLYIMGCAFRMKQGVIFKENEAYILVNTVRQMKELFGPIESATEALSYAQLMTGLSARYELSFDPTLLYLQASIEGTHVTEEAGSYSMNLYHTRWCGCEPMMTSEVILQVDRDGTITWKSARPVWFTTGYSCAD
jgi:hypothetical protein